MEAPSGASQPPPLAYTLRRNAVRSLAEGDFDAAEAALEQLKSIAPLWVDTRGLELELLIKLDRLDAARALATQLAGVFPRSARIQYLAGLVHYKSRRYAEARRLFEESDRLYPHWGTRRYVAKALSQVAATRAEAEAILAPLAREHPRCWLDLAWVHQQNNDVDRAIEATQRFLQHHPENTYARERLQALKARCLEPGDVRTEVETLLELGEPVSNDLLAGYFEALLKTGNMTAARDFFGVHGHRLNARGATGIGWIAYRLKAYDLAVDWFLAGLDANCGDVKFFSALEKASELAARCDAVARAYKERIPTDKRFYGHLQRLQKRLDREPAP